MPRLRPLLVLLALLLPMAPAPAAMASAPLDWCAPLVVWPDQRWWSTSSCEAWWKRDTIARDADFVLDGVLQPAAANAVKPDRFTCTGDLTQQNTRAYHDDLRARAAALGRTLTFVYLARFDVVPRAFAAAPGFDASFLVQSAQPFSERLDFFRLDTSAPCVCGCEWSDTPGPTSVPAGTRLRDFIDASGGPDAHESKVIYGLRPSTGGSLEGAPRYFYGSSALADQTNAAYRAWMVQQISDIVSVGGFDAVELNNKFHQYSPADQPPWWGGAKAPTVDGYLKLNDTLWSGPASGYGYQQYLQGWSALAADLTTAGIPYTVSLLTTVWRPNSYYDDPSTPGIDEATIIRGVARGARFVFLERQSGFSDAEWAAAIADIQSAGAATVVPIRTTCGYGGPDHPVVPLPALTTSLTVTPEAGATSAYAATGVSVTPGGTSTGAWDADFWCRCPTPPCGVPDASVRGQTAASWQIPAGLCDATFRTATGSYTARARITRGGFTVDGTDRVTICAPACANGRDDDRDGNADFPADAGCADAGRTFENPACNDGRDNDGDGLVDVADPQCTGNPANAAESFGCGLGAELALVVPLLQRLRRRLSIA